LEQPEFVKEIEDQKNTNFKVTKIPVWALKEFKQYCKKECGDVYFVGIIQLLNIKKRYEDLNLRLNSLQKQLDEIKPSKVRLIKTFGDKDVKTI